MSFIAGALAVAGIAIDIIKDIVVTTIADDIRERMHKKKNCNEPVTIQTRHLHEQIEKQVEVKSTRYGVAPKELRTQTEAVMNSLVDESDQFSYSMFHKELNITYDPNDPNEVQRVLDDMFKKFCDSHNTSKTNTNGYYDINDPNAVTQELDAMLEKFYHNPSRPVAPTIATRPMEQKPHGNYQPNSTNPQDPNSFFIPVDSEDNK